MTRIFRFLVGAALLVLTPLPAAAGDLTLRDVMELRRTGMSDDLLIAIIDADGGPFRLSFADIHDLKSDGLSERVIAALVRTGGNQPLMAVEPMPGAAVQGYHEVITYVPAVIVVDSPALRSHSDAQPRHHSRRVERPGNRHGDRTHQPQLPPATWVTRQEDGENVTASGKSRSSVPAATWVTPRDPLSRQPSESPRATPR